MKTLVIIPAYNEAENIKSVIDDITLNCPGADCLVINDCSTDNTADLLEKLNVKHLNLPVNLGIGGCVQTGYLYAVENAYDIVIQFDGDGQHNAKYLNDLISPIESGNADVAIGSRFIEKEGFQSTAMRRFGINFLSGLIRMLSGVNVKDVTSGMRATGRKMTEVYSVSYAQDYPEPEALLTAGIENARIVEVPVQMRARAGGVSSISPIKSVYYMIKVTLALLVSGLFKRRRKE